MADGKIVIISAIDSDGAQKGAKEIAKELEKIYKESEDTGEKIRESVGGGFEEIFKATALSDLATDALKEIGQAAVDMAKEAVEAAAEIRASNAQFAQTFKGVEKQATTALEAIADQTGITATRMQDAYTSIYAFSKSVGADTENALDISSRAMQAAADSAAYYDRSIEEATETLQSFLKGNYENDAALGIAATETTRNAKANELYAKSFQDLSESQKVDVLLAMVEAGNQASGAMGQAAREADAWTNVTGELQEAWRQFLGVLGEPILDAISPAIQQLTEFLRDLTEVSGSKKLAKGLRELESAVKDANKQYEESAAEIERNAAAAEYYVDRLEELEAAGLDTAEAQREYASIVELLSELMPDLNLTINEQTGLLKQNTEWIRSSVEAMKEQAVYEAKLAQYNALLSARAEAVILQEEAEKALQETQQQGVELQNKYASATGNATAAQSGFAKFLEIVTNAITGASEGLYGTTSSMDSLTAATAENAQEQNALEEAMTDAEEQVAGYDKEIDALAKDLGIAETALDETTAAQERATASAQKTTESIQIVSDAYLTAKEAARTSIESQIGYFEELELESSMSAEEIVSNWNKQAEALQNYGDNLQKAIEMGFDQRLVQQLSDGTEQSMAILDEFVNGTEMSVQEINEAFLGVYGEKGDVAGYLSLLETHYGEVMQALLGDTDITWDEIVDLIDDAMKKSQDSIDGLEGTTVDIILRETVVRAKGSTGGSVKENMTVSPYSLTESVSAYALTDNVPYLASGAVIPPNAPFVAVLGDQRSGTNLEAPESLIRKIVREESGRQGGTYQFTAQINRRVLFDEMIEEAKERQLLMGGDPFDLS